MKKSFPGYYRPTEKEFSALWNTCLFVLDANVLLNLYRYSERTVEELFQMLSEMSERLWVPHQAALEYQRGRLSVISQQKEAYERIRRWLTKTQDNLESDLQIYSRHPLINVESLTEKINSAFANAKEELNRTKQKHPDLIQDDLLRDRLTVLLDGKVGPPYTSEKREEIYRIGEKRYREKVPPGYSDAKKGEIDKYGDLVLWFQIIDKAKEISKSIIFVTDDGKEDWWYQFNGQTVGPRPELVEEMLVKAGAPFYMYHTDPFMEHMQKNLKRKIEPKTIEEVRVTRQQDEKTVEIYKRLSEKLSELQSALSQSKGTTPSNEMLTLIEKIAKMQESEPSPWVKSAIESMENLESDRSQTRMKTKIKPLFRFDDEKECPKCGAGMLLDHDTGEYHCEKCGQRE